MQGGGLLLTLAILLGLARMVVVLWRRYGLQRLEYRRTFDRHHCFAGEEVILTLEVTNRKLLPVPHLTIDEAVPDGLEISARRLKLLGARKNAFTLHLALAWYQKVIRRYRVKAARRGLFRLGPATLLSSDPFGYTECTGSVGESELLIVYPRILPLAQLAIPSYRPFGEMRSADRLFEDPLRFAGVRHYQLGDPLNRIHWKASAASGTLQVMLLEPSRSAGLAVFLNAWSFAAAWQGIDPVAFESGCCAAASILAHAHAEGLAIGLFANGVAKGWGLSLRLPPSRAPEALAHALEGLARLEPISSDALPVLMADEIGRLGYGTSIVIITRYVDEALAAAVLSLQRTRRPVTLVLTGSDSQLPAVLTGVRTYTVAHEEVLRHAVLA